MAKYPFNLGDFNIIQTTGVIGEKDQKALTVDLKPGTPDVVANEQEVAEMLEDAFPLYTIDGKPYKFSKYYGRALGGGFTIIMEKVDKA